MSNRTYRLRTTEGEVYKISEETYGRLVLGLLPNFIKVFKFGESQTYVSKDHVVKIWEVAS